MSKMKEAFKKARIWNLIAVISSLIPICYTASIYQLTAPSEYVAFSGDLAIQFAIPNHVSIPQAFIRLVLITDTRPEEITTLHSIASEYKSGTRKIQCGIIEVAGNYELQMHMFVGGLILVRTSVIVRWPNVTLQLPYHEHKAQSSSVPLTIQSDAVCNPLLRRYSFQVNLEYASNSSGISIAGREEILYHIPFSNFSAPKFVIEFPCSLFDVTGMYRASFVSSFSAISIVARSNVMTTALNPAYQIKIWSQTIFPCHSILQVDYVQPQCPGDKENNRIRMYMLRRQASGSPAAPLKKTYLQERSVDPDRTTLFVNCSDFRSAAAGYCFQYVTFARDKAIINQTELCLSAHPNSVLPIDGGWSQWSAWSTCSVKCGDGNQNRHRMCNSPTPNYGGAFCAGEPLESRPCGDICEESIPRTPLHTFKAPKCCLCGCEMRKEQGEIIASGRCEKISSWLITAPKNFKIKLSFMYLNFYKNKQWVKVRNGGRPDSDLIAFSDGRKEITHLTSTSNQMLIEFWSEPNRTRTDTGNRTKPDPCMPLMNATRPIHVHGFIAAFSTNETAPGVFAVSAQPVQEAGKPSIWESTVTIVGIGLCGLVVITATAFVIYHRTCHKRHHKYAMAAHEESPKRMCKSTSMQSTPSRESHHGIEIEHDMETPLTGNNISDKKRVKTPGSTKSRTSFSSACSHNAKMLKTKVEIEYGGSRRASPLTPKGDYSPIPQCSSPRKHSRTHEIAQDSEPMSLFRTSPLLKPKAPRSPKVHPSPKFKKPKSQKSSSNEFVNSKRSKHDILSKRFDQRKPETERVVMGSDHTPTSSVKSPPSESYKTDCETPTNINLDMSKITKRSGNNDSSVLNQSNDISLKDLDKSTDDTDRKPASGTSDDSTSTEKSPGSQMTTSFIENGVKARRPTSLTESYSKMSIASLMGKLSSAENSKNSSDCNNKDRASVTSSDDRQQVLPKPDGQSPKSPRIEMVKTASQNSSPNKTSKGSTPKSVRSLKSDRTDTSGKNASPARSINTPSDTVELEYDDFIDMDDTYSYFDPIETEKLTWHGVEKVKVTTPKTEK